MPWHNEKLHKTPYMVGRFITSKWNWRAAAWLTRGVRSTDCGRRSHGEGVVPSHLFRKYLTERHETACPLKSLLSVLHVQVLVQLQPGHSSTLLSANRYCNETGAKKSVKYYSRGNTSQLLLNCGNRRPTY